MKIIRLSENLRHKLLLIQQALAFKELEDAKFENDYDLVLEEAIKTNEEIKETFLALTSPVNRKVITIKKRRN